MAIKHVIKINEGDVFVTPAKAMRSSHRRVVGVLGGRVMYSAGGESNRDCLVRTFRQWVRRVNAIHPRHKTTEPWSV